MSRPNIYEYDRTAIGAGSQKDGDRLSGEDLRNLENMGYSLQEIVDYSENMTASGSTKQGGKAQAVLDNFRERITQQQAAEEEAAREAAREETAPEPARQQEEQQSSSGSNQSNGSGNSSTTTTIVDNSYNNNNN